MIRIPAIKLLYNSTLIRSNASLLRLNASSQPTLTLHAKTFAVTSMRNSDPKHVAKSSMSDEKSKENAEPTSHDTSQRMVKAQYLDKKSLVWDKRYKSVADVPEMLPYQTIVQSRNRFRIRANLFMIGLTVLGAIVMVYTGKERAKTGDSVEKRNLERHRQLRAQKAEEDRAAQTAGADK